jgi:hypothetical protein
MSAGYAGKDIPDLESTIDERIVDFVRRIEQNWLSTAEGTKSFDIARRIQYLTVDVITHLSFGKPLGFVEADTDKFNFLATIETQLPIVQHFSVILELNTWLSRAANIKWLGKYLVPSHTDKTGIGMIMGVRKSNTSNVLRHGTFTFADFAQSCRNRSSRLDSDSTPRRKRTCWDPSSPVA